MEAIEKRIIDLMKEVEKSKDEAKEAEDRLKRIRADLTLYSNPFEGYH